MADFILHRKISVDTYPFPEGAFQIYGGGKFYNGFSIGESVKLTVVNEDGVLKFSRDRTPWLQETTSVILGTIPQNNKVSIYIDIASPLPNNVSGSFKIGSTTLITGEPWVTAKIYHTESSGTQTQTLQAGGVLSINFLSPAAAEAIPNLCEVRALWAL